MSTHRERVITALSHRKPDRVPLDLGGTRDSSIVVEAYERLKQYFGVASDNVLTSRMMRVVDVDERILEALDTDVRGVFPQTIADIPTGERRYKDEWGVERIWPTDVYYYEQTSFPLAGQITKNDILGYSWPNPQHPIRRQGLRERVRQLRKKDCAIVLNMPSGFVHVSQYLRGFEDWFADFAWNQELLALLFDAILEVNLAICAVLLDEVGDEVDVLMASDDLGLQNGLMVSPHAYRKLIKPRHAKYFAIMHEMSAAKVLFHTCGSVVDIIDDLIEIGVDILNPVQVSAAGMDPDSLKRKYGPRLAFWGGIDTQRVLPWGGVQEVKQEVESRIEQLGQEGGFVLGAVHNIQPDVPLENTLAMYRHAREYRPRH